MPFGKKLNLDKYGNKTTQAVKHFVQKYKKEIITAIIVVSIMIG